MKSKLLHNKNSMKQIMLLHLSSDLGHLSLQAYPRICVLLTLLSYCTLFMLYFYCFVSLTN